MKLQMKRAYDAPEDTDGTRILVDRLWPRGLSRDKAAVDVWLKEIAPSTELRRWYHHDPEKWEEFQRRYIAELKENPEAISQLKAHTGRHAATLLYSAKDADHSNARVLLEFVRARRK